MNVLQAIEELADRLRRRRCAACGEPTDRDPPSTGRLLCLRCRLLVELYETPAPDALVAELRRHGTLRMAEEILDDLSHLHRLDRGPVGGKIQIKGRSRSRPRTRGSGR